jgi:hypothetical protein
MSAYLSPETASPAAPSLSTWAVLRLIDSDARFSSTRAARRVPGIGTDATLNASAR